MALFGTVSSDIHFRNRIINGDMRIDQRNNGAAITVPTVNPGFAVDRFKVDQAADSVLTVQQTTDAPEGFTNSLRITVATPDASIGDAQFVQIQHIFEGFNTADLGWGTANAKTVTLSFWVKSSVTGQYPVRLVNNGGSRSYPFYVTINTANTWEFKTATIVGPTNGTFPINNTQSFGLGISLAVGSNFVGATPNIWNSTTSFLAANIANNTGFIATTGATFQITGVQLEVGAVATPFERRPFGTELALCQRYFEQSDGDLEYGAAGSAITGSIPYIVPKRATPTFVFTDIVGNVNRVTLESTNNVTVAAGLIGTSGGRYARCRASISGASTGSFVRWRYTADAEL